MDTIRIRRNLLNEDTDIILDLDMAHTSRAVIVGLDGNKEIAILAVQRSASDN
jgi:hypothetical protein